MENLKFIAKNAAQTHRNLPFSVYASVSEQHIINVPVIKPVLIFVLEGCKKLGKTSETTCKAGSFVFLSNSPRIDMRNISGKNGYFALLIEFEFSDFDCFERTIAATNETSFQGEITPLLQGGLQKMLECSLVAPAELWQVRRQEILQILNHLGHQQVRTVVEPPSLSHRVHNIVSARVAEELSLELLCAELAMSESTLRRKLSAEGSNFQAFKDRAKLGHGLHLLQSSFEPIGRIAEQCGYQSQSRFTDKFKRLFGVTPSALRKTRLPE